MKRKHVLLFLLSLILLSLVLSIMINAQIQYRIQGVVYYKDQTGASGVKIEVLEEELILKSTKTDGGGKYKADVELLENHEYAIRLSNDKIQTLVNKLTTPTHSSDTEEDDDDESEQNIYLDFTVNRIPKAEANGEYNGFIHEPVLFNSEGSNDPDLDSIFYEWNFGDGKYSLDSNPIHIYLIPGDYDVSLTVTDIDSSFDIDYTKCKVENRPPIIVLNGPYNAKEGAFVAFNSTGTYDPDGEIVSYHWDFDDGSISTKPNPTHSYLEKGDYDVKLLVTDNFGLETEEAIKCIISENKPPLSNANGPYSSYAEEQIQFSSSGSTDPDDTDLSFHWEFGDGSSSKLSDPTHTYLETGTYIVNLTVSDPSGLYDSDITETIVMPPLPKPPIAKVNGPYTGYTKQPVYFSSTGSYDPDGEITEYLWDFGDGQLSTDQSPSHIYLAENTYNVTLTVVDNDGIVVSDSTTCRIDSASFPTPINTIIPNKEPIAKGNGPYIGFTNCEILFSSNNSYDVDGEIVEYLWGFGDGGTSAEANPSHIYEEPGNYDVFLIVIDNEGKEGKYYTTCTVSLSNISPVAKINVKSTAKVGEVLKFNSTDSYDLDGEITEYYWDFGDGGFSVEPNPSYSYLNSDQYIVILTINDSNGAENSSEKNIDIIQNILPTPVIEGPDSAEIGESIMFLGDSSYDADGEIVEYLFDFGDNTFSYGSQVTHIYDESGTYTVNLIVKDDTQSENISTIDLVVFNNKPPKIVADTLYRGVEGEQVLFNAYISDDDGTISKICWSFGDGNTSEEKKPVHIYDNPGEYTIQIHAIDNDGKVSTFSTVALIDPKEKTKFPFFTSFTMLVISFSYYFRKNIFRIANG
jgi:PKD repeat protein